MAKVSGQVGQTPTVDTGMGELSTAFRYSLGSKNALTLLEFQGGTFTY